MRVQGPVAIKELGTIRQPAFDLSASRNGFLIGDKWIQIPAASIPMIGSIIDRSGSPSTVALQMAAISPR